MDEKTRKMIISLESRISLLDNVVIPAKKRNISNKKNELKNLTPEEELARHALEVNIKILEQILYSYKEETKKKKENLKKWKNQNDKKI